MRDAGHRGSATVPNKCVPKCNFGTRGAVKARGDWPTGPLRSKGVASLFSRLGWGELFGEADGPGGIAKIVGTLLLVSFVAGVKGGVEG